MCHLFYCLYVFDLIKNGFLTNEIRNIFFLEKFMTS